VTRGRKALLLAISTVLSVALAVAVNVATGGSLPEPVDRLQWAAWPLVGLLALALVLIGMREAERGPLADGSRAIRPAELPPDITAFAGHEHEFAALRDLVPRQPKAGLGAPTVIGIFGAGGVGKTVLATHLAHAVADRYPDGQIFVELRGASPEPADPAEVVRRVLHALGVAADDVPEDPGARQALYRSVLADRRVLLYLDDAADEEQVRPLIPAGGGCLVLVTARPSLVATRLTAWRNLDVLAEAEALELLAVISGVRDRLADEPEAATQLARHCGYLPLALGVAAARLRNRPQWSVADLAARLEDERRRLDELHAGNLDVRASIGLSYDDLDPVAGRLFRRLSLLGYANFGPGVAAALLGGQDRWPLSETTLEHLADVKLVEVAGPRRYRFHDLVRLYARERLEAEEPAAERQAALLRSLDYYIGRTRAQWQALADPSTGKLRRSDAEHWFERSRSAIVAAVLRCAEAGEPERAWRLAAAAAPYLESRGYPVDLARVSEIAVRSARAAGNRVALAGALRTLGQAERHRSRHEEALAAFTESLALREELGEHRRVAEALRRIGDIHRDSGHLAEAEEAYGRSIQVYRAHGEPRDVALVQAALAVVWLQEGRVDEAVELVEQAEEELLVADSTALPDRSGAWALETLGVARLAAGRPADAEACHHRSLASFRSRRERFGSATALLNLARCAAAQGQQDRARTLYAESRAIFTEMGNTDGQRDVEQGLAELSGRGARRR
jgi:tetratricopeptide (TPR) repeat protein